jgi:hypothetical protein
LITEGRYPVKTAKRISESAMAEIYRSLCDKHSLMTHIWDILDEVGLEWTSKAGNWPKRFAKVMKKRGHVFTNDYLSQIGKIARESCILSKGTELIVTTNFNWTPGKYGDGGSCFWGCRSASKVILKGLNSYAILLHGEEDSPIARCWCSPYEQSYVVYNCYSREGEPINLVSFSRMLSDTFNMPYYRDIELTCDGMEEGPLWINGGRGYIIGDQSVSEISEVDFNYRLECDDCGRTCTGSAVYEDGRVLCGNCEDESEHYHCVNCGDHIHSDDVFYEDDDADEPYCEECFYERFARCYGGCDQYARLNDHFIVNGEIWCRYCFEDHGATCTECGETMESDNACYLGHSDAVLCESCAEKLTTECRECGDLILTRDSFTTADGDAVCEYCLDKKYFVCVACDEYYPVSEMKLSPKLNRLCPECHAAELAETNPLMRSCV